MSHITPLLKPPPIHSGFILENSKVHMYNGLQDSHESILHLLTSLTLSRTTYFWLSLLIHTKDISASVFSSLFSAENTLHPGLFIIHSLGSLFKSHLLTKNVPDHMYIYTCTHTCLYTHILFICHTLVFSKAPVIPDITYNICIFKSKHFWKPEVYHTSFEVSCDWNVLNSFDSKNCSALIWGCF